MSAARLSTKVVDVMRFVHDSHAQRVRFASGGAAQALAAEVEERHARRVMLIADPSQEALARAPADGLPIAAYHGDVVMHVPVETAERARRAAPDAGADLVVSIGGGSATGLAKAVALTTELPIVALPTTYAGSEGTSVWGLTEGARKTTGVDARVLPRTVIYDATLTLALPVDLSVASGLNALAHCVDSMWAPRADPINAAFAAEGIRALREGLPRIVGDPSGLPGREQVLYAAYLSAVAFSSAGSGLHHKICHVLGGRCGLPHAQTHAVVLPYVLAVNGPAAPEAERRIAQALDADDALKGLAALRERLDAPERLSDYGLAEDAIPGAAAEILAAVPPSNPRALAQADMEALLRAALAGEDPRSIALEGATT